MSATYIWPERGDGPVLAVTNDAQYVLRDYAGMLIATWPGSPTRNGGGVTMTEHAYTAPFCRPPGEAWSFVGECTDVTGRPAWCWRRLWALALGGA